MRRQTYALFMLGCTIILTASAPQWIPLLKPAAGQPVSPTAPLFKPSGLWISGDGTRLYVAGAGAGELAIVRLDSHRVEAIVPVGTQLADLDGTDQAQALAAPDPEANRLFVLGLDGKMLHSVPLRGGPWRCVVFEDDDGAFAAVSCRWARCVELVDIRSGRVVGTIPLGFSPGELLYLPRRQMLVIADAFQGNVAVFRLVPTLRPDGSWAVFADHVLTRKVPAHNIRGLATDARERTILITHMLLTETAPTTRENVHWGITMTSNLRVLPLAKFLDPEANPFAAGRTHFVGDAGHAAGDPGRIVVTPDDRIVFCLSGVHDIGMVELDAFGVRRVDVGHRPVDLALSGDGKTAFVANYFDDSITVVSLTKEQTVGTIQIRLGRPLTLVELGERLFYDATLSLDGWFSCHSCHTDGHTCGLNADTLGDGSYGAPKNIPTLLGTGETGPWGWIGAFDSLADQVSSSLRTSMRSPHDISPRMVAAIVAYLRSLPPPPPASYRELDEAKVERGRRLFERLQCGRCHRPVGFFTSEGVHDVGLDDGPGGNRQFNPPSLRGVAYTAPYLHDGRAATLEEVFMRWRHKVPRRLSDEQILDLVEYLLSL